MSALYQSRKNTLIQPLNIDEIGYVYDSKHITKMVEDIKKAKFGSYLVGGVVGAGKTSQVEIASHLASKSAIIVHANFYSQEECIEKFDKILLDSLVKEIKKKQIEKEFELLENIIDSCEKKLGYALDEEETVESTKDSKEEKHLSKNIGLGGGLGTALNCIFSSNVHVSSEIVRENSRNDQQNTLVKNTVTMTKIQPTYLDYIYQLLDALIDKKVVFIYDELDKMDEDVLKILFSKYKLLFVEKNVFNYFIVNDKIYRKYVESNLIDNPIYSYFMDRYYIPLLDFEETLRYTKMMFGEDRYINGMVTYYLCCGNYRLINQRYLSTYSINEIDIIKSYIFLKVIEKMWVPYFDNCTKDCTKDILAITIKTIIEKTVTLRSFQIDELIEKIKSKSICLDVGIDCTAIVKAIIEVIKVICPNAINIEHNIVNMNWEQLISSITEIIRLVKADRKEPLPEEQMDTIHISDMYCYGIRDYKYSRGEIPYLSYEIIPLKVANNSPESYKEILINILHTSMMEARVQVIVIRRARGEESFCTNDYEYTGIVIVDRGCYELAYYVDRGSYDSDRYDAVDGLIKEAERLCVNINYLLMLEPLDLDNEMYLIAARHNKPQSKLYEHRKVVQDRWT